MRRVRIIGVTAVLMTALATAVFGQTVSATTGALNGKVVDASGGVLPGVTVTITSPSMQGVQSDVTNAEGNYRFPALPPGVYKVVYELPGFATLVREGIRVGLGVTVTLNADMKVAGLEESVTVSGDAPVVDVQSTRTATNFDAQLLASLPNARDMWSILAEAPAVQMTRIDVGGSTAGTQTGYTAYDARGGQNRVMIDGLVTTEGTDAIGVYVDYGAFEEVSVGTASHNAEMGWPGVQTQFIAKSGGNEYHGSFYADYQNESIQAHNIDADQIARGAQGGVGLAPEDVNRMHLYRDFNAEAGGYLKKDKLWWYGSYRNFNVEARYPNFPVKPHQTALQHYTGKGTFALSPSNKLIGFAQVTHKLQPNRLDTWEGFTGINTSELSTQYQSHWAWVVKGEWNKVISDKAFAEVRGGTFGYNWPLTPNGEAPRYEDIGNNYVSGSNRDWIESRRRHQVLGSMSYFKDDWGGDHNLKFGGEVFYETLDRKWFNPTYYNNVIQILRNGAPAEVILFETPSHLTGGLWTWSGYINDIWRLSSRLTLTPGLRYDRYREFLPEQVHPVGPFNPTEDVFPAVDNVITWNVFAPRLGVTYDLLGNGRTVLKFNYARYYWNPSVLSDNNPNAAPWYRRYNWSDPNRSGVWEPGEEGTLTRTVGGSAAQSIDPNLKDTHTDELATWFERELIANFGIRTGFVYRAIRDRYSSYNAAQPFASFNVPVQIPDPGPDGVTGTSDDGPSIAGFNLDPTLVGVASRNVLANAPAKNDYYTFEISGNKRMSHRWSLMVAYTQRWNHDDASSFFGNSTRANTLPRTPNDLINTADDDTYHYTTWAFKVHSMIEAPWGLRLTPMLRHQAGQPWGRTFSARFNYGTIRVLAEPLDTRRQDNLTIFDLRSEKVFRLAKSRSISVFVDLYNIFNSNAEQNINWSSGTTFLRPLTIISPRIARFGAKFQW